MRDGPTALAPASLPDDDDLLLEFFLRLTPLPSSLPRASLVCKRWRRLLSDPGFLRRYRAHHKTPPMLGFFIEDFFSSSIRLAFTPTLTTPDRIPPARLSTPRCPDDALTFLGCRHGLALFISRRDLEAVVWDPITRRRYCIAFPPELKKNDQHHQFKMDM